MPESLRSRVVEAGARAIANDRAEELDVWHFDDARAALDAMLDCLTKNVLNVDPPVRGGTYVDELLAVLRDSE